MIGGSPIGSAPIGAQTVFFVQIVVASVLMAADEEALIYQWVTNW